METDAPKVQDALAFLQKTSSAGGEGGSVYEHLTQLVMQASTARLCRNASSMSSAGAQALHPCMACRSWRSAPATRWTSWRRCCLPRGVQPRQPKCRVSRHSRQGQVKRHIFPRPSCSCGLHDGLHSAQISRVMRPGRRVACRPPTHLPVHAAGGVDMYRVTSCSARLHCCHVALCSLLDVPRVL